ncbi:MAG: gmhB [Gemmatimonadetes bacterium]|nr:gmhB [Gemmatimonadota bacterium]
MTSTDRRAAIFLDRDGTLMRDAHYVGRAEQVVLIPGAAAALRAVNEARVPAILVTNQSGIGRGYFTEQDYERVHARLSQLLAAEGAHLDAAYHCPHAPADQCECRKPGTLLFRRAAEEHALDPARSWSLGDRGRDLQALIALGGRGLLVPSDNTPAAEVDAAQASQQLMPNLGEAVRVALTAMLAQGAPAE